MERFHHFAGLYSWLIPLIIFCALWDTIWKLTGMWKAGRNNDLPWFLCIAIFNTLGILPIIYILLKKRNLKVKRLIHDDSVLMNQHKFYD